MTLQELFEQQHGGKDAKTSTDHGETFTALCVLDFARKYANIKWDEACEAQRKACANEYPSFGRETILNAPKPEFKP